MTWRKSSFSGDGSDGNTECVEVAQLDNATAVRDSKNADGPILTIPVAAWRALLVWS